MEIHRVVKSQEDCCHPDAEEVVLTGRLNAREVRLAQTDPVTFLKSAEMDVPDDADIQVSIHNFSSSAARKVGVGLLCRYTITCVGRICIIQIVCIPVIVIACW